MKTTVAGDTGIIAPVEPSIVAAEVLLDVHTPPATVDFKVSLLAKQMLAGPDKFCATTVADLVIVTALVAIEVHPPAATEYLTVSIPLAVLFAVNTRLFPDPVSATLVIEVFVCDQTPVVVAPETVIVVELLEHIACVPVSVPGFGADLI